MGIHGIAVGIAFGVTLVATLAYYIFEQRRYLTNNPNAVGDHFRVFRDSDNCPVCMDSLELESPSTAILSCGHVIHRRCLLDMENHRQFYETNRCPICRTPVRLH